MRYLRVALTAFLVLGVFDIKTQAASVTGEVSVVKLLPPSKPTGIKTISGDRQVTIRWSPVPGAVSYNIYRSRSPLIVKSNGSRIARASSPYTLKGLDNGVACYILITALNAAGESADSAMVSGIPQPTAPPAAPKGISVMVGDGQITVRWKPVPGATSYNLYRSLIPGVSKINGYKISDVKNPQIDKGFINGTAYFMVVTAVNAAGESVESSEVTATPGIPEPPAAPASVEAISSDRQIAVRWAPVPRATSYNLYISRYPGAGKAGYQIPNVSSPWLYSHFSNGVRYFISVTAVNASGEGPESLEVSALPAAAAPQAAPDPSVPSDLSSTRVFPNPWKIDRDRNLPVTFDRLTRNATVKIFNPAGELVATLPTADFSTTWDLRNDSGQSVASGLYVYLITNGSGQKNRGLLGVVK